MNSHPWCVRCGLRWQQKLGLCRRCERETGVDNRSLFERQRESVARRRARYNAPHVVPVSAPIREVVVNGVAFDIVWDGAIR
jgi:hypothetical protein